jgi:putative ABC transport system permease protein
LSSFWQDIRYALRSLRKRPVATGAILLTLGLSIGGSVSIYSVVNGVLLSPLPYQNPEQLVAIWTKGEDSERGDVAPADFRDFQQARSFEGIAAASTYFDVNLTGDGNPERLDAAVVSSNLFSILGIAPERGSGFEPQHDRIGGERVVVLGHPLWQRRFGSDPGIVGKTIILDGERYTVRGVMSETFHFPDRDTEMWLPLSFLGERLERRSQSFLSLVGRLKPGVGVEAGRADLAGIARRLESDYPESNAGRSVTVIPLHEAVVGQVRKALYILLGAVGCVLLIACANVTSLVVAQALTRQREVALRSALGASRARSARQPLIESILLSLAGGALGLLLARWGVDALLLLSSNLPRLDEIRIDGKVLGFSLLLSLVTGLIVGAVPAFRASRPNLSETLKEGGRTSTGRHSLRLRSLLMSAEIALSLVLLIGAGLLIKSFVQLLSVHPGFSPDNTVTMRISLSDKAYPGEQERSIFFQQLIGNIAALPGVDTVGAVSRLPMGKGNITSSLTVEGSTDETPHEAGLRIVSSDYFRAMRIPLLQGRTFAGSDASTAPPVVLVNQTLAQRFWPGQGPLNKRLKLGPPDSESPWITVVGVVGDVRHFGLEKPPQPEVFLHIPQNPAGGMTLVVRTESDPLSKVSAIRNEVAALDPTLPIYDVDLLEDILNRSMAERRFTMLLLGFFAGMALLLATVGIYGGIAEWVAHHRHEIGTRLALGAQRREILSMVIGRGMALTAAGLVLGLPVALWMRGIIQALLFGITSNDLETFVAVPLFLVAIALLACSLPAWKAAQVDPMTALRSE